jgi:hypothetical protein
MMGRLHINVVHSTVMGDRDNIKIKLMEGANHGGRLLVLLLKRLKRISMARIVCRECNNILEFLATFLSFPPKFWRLP